VVDCPSHKLKKITKDGRVVSVAGSTKGIVCSSYSYSHVGYADGPGSEAKFDLPSAVCLDKDGNYIVAGMSAFVL
jgi:hypothetical protein